MDTDHDCGGFPAFFAEAEPRLRRSLVAMYGAERGREAAAEALAYGWEHWPKVKTHTNPIGYLFRVGQSRTRTRLRAVPYLPPESSDHWYEPTLPEALKALSKHQRTTVVLVHGYGWTLREVAELLGVKVTTVQNHLGRGLARLRDALKVTDHA